MSEDYLSRVNLPDLYPRKSDPFRPAAGAIPPSAPWASQVSAEELIGVELYSSLTTVGQRPIVYQRALNFSLTVGTEPVRIVNNQFQCDTIVLNVYSTAANSVFFGYGAGVTTTSGLEIQPGIPISITPENVREQWELQRALEAIAAILANDRGLEPLGAFRAPRVVFNASEYFLVAAASTSVSIMLFNVPELQ